MRSRTRLWGALIFGVILANHGCATLAPAPLGPADIPALEERAARRPGDGEAQLHLGVALAAAGRCGEAVEAAERGRALAPGDPVGPLVIGQCLEESGDFEGAVGLYARFVQDYAESPGVAVVEGRRVTALQQQAREQARLVVEREEALGPANPQTVGVFPFIVDGDSAYHPLSVGLAHMLTTDLALLRRFPLVERVQLNALLQELDVPAELIDPATAARAGRLMGASRMILGTVSIPSDREIQLSGNIVLGTGELVEPLTTEGALRDLLSLEKEYALQIAENLGYQLTEAERQRILENQPGSLAAFLAFSRGILSEDLGDFRGATAHFQDAVQADPQYGEAQERLRGAVGADALNEAGPGGVAAAVASVDQNLGASPEMAFSSSALASSMLDIASHQPERATIGVGTANVALDVLPGDSQVIPSLEALITILIWIRR
jgi:tetratricopeptide (TPR) repeat protein